MNTLPMIIPTYNIVSHLFISWNWWYASLLKKAVTTLDAEGLFAHQAVSRCTEDNIDRRGQLSS